MNDPKPGMWDRDLALEAPLLLRLHGHWADRCRDGRLPARSQFDPVDMRWAMGSIFLVEARPELEDFRYTLIGSEIVRNAGVDNSGRLVSEVFGATGLALYREIRDERRPIRVHGPMHWRNKLYRGHETLILPLADDGRTVDRFIGGMVFHSVKL